MNIEDLIDKYGIRVHELDEYTIIQVGETENQDFYQELTEYLKSSNAKIYIANGIVGKATKEEFLEGEEIIQKLLEEIQPNWTKKQIVAYVHYKMGELISYVPDFNFNGAFVNSENAQWTRNIWQSLVRRESVCNGIISISRNILSRTGIATKELVSGGHSFLLAEIEGGNIITDPTWDLKNTLYGARPMYFGKTYEQLREQENGLSNAHKLDNPPENVIEISEKELREIYYTLGFAKEDRTFRFPILDKVSEIEGNTYESSKQRLSAFFEMFTKNFSQEATHLSETRTLLQDCLYTLGIKPRDLTTKFIYKKEDIDCNNPHLCLLVNDEQKREQMVYCLDSEMMKFIDMDVEELDNKYKLHDLDIVKPFWEKYLIQKERGTDELKTQQYMVGVEQSKESVSREDEKKLFGEFEKFESKKAEIGRIDKAIHGLQKLAQGHKIKIDKGDKNFQYANDKI